MKREPSRKFRLSTTLKPNEGNSSSSSNGSRQPSRKSQKERYRIKGNWIVFIIHNNTFDVTLWQMLSHSLYLSRTHTPHTHALTHTHTPHAYHTHTHHTHTRAHSLSQRMFQSLSCRDAIFMDQLFAASQYNNNTNNKEVLTPPQ